MGREAGACKNWLINDCYYSFRTIIAATVLHENVSPMRYLAILGVNAGAIAIKVS